MYQLILIQPELNYAFSLKHALPILKFRATPLYTIDAIQAFCTWTKKGHASSLYIQYTNWLHERGSCLRACETFNIIKQHKYRPGFDKIYGNIMWNPRNYVTELFMDLIWNLTVQSKEFVRHIYQLIYVCIHACQSRQ